MQSNAFIPSLNDCIHANDNARQSCPITIPIILTYKVCKDKFKGLIYDVGI